MAIVITKQPINVMAAVGSTILFSVEAEGEELTYQWEYLTLGSSSWVNNTMDGNTTATLTVTVRSYHDGYKYRCLITDANGDTLRTDEVTLLTTTGSSVGFINCSTLAAIADAIRAKTETTESMLPSEMAGLIEAISTGAALPAWISEIEFVQVTCTTSASLSVPCGLTDLAHFALIFRDTSVSTVITYNIESAAYNGKRARAVLFGPTSASNYTAGIVSPTYSQSAGVYTFPSVSSEGLRWSVDKSYNVIMGRCDA